MRKEIVRFTCAEDALDVGTTTAGQGPAVLFLPALSSISTREEMVPLAGYLDGQFETVCIDWPGFGTLPRPRANWSPEILSRFLSERLQAAPSRPRAIVAAGHAAGYALRHFAIEPEPADALILIAPTWRGPLPTMMNGQRKWFGRIRSAVDSAVIGPLLYRLNVNSLVIRKMAREHVYSDRGWLTIDRLNRKLAVTQAEGARHASVRFVTGGLDIFADRTAFLDCAAQIRKPMLIIYGSETPPRSLAEMDALAQLPDVQVKRLAHGKLAIHEEFPEEVAVAILEFLGERRMPAI